MRLILTRLQTLYLRALHAAEEAQQFEHSRHSEAMTFAAIRGERAGRGF